MRCDYLYSLRRLVLGIAGAALILSGISARMTAEARKARNESAAIDALRIIAAAQTEFRERDLEGDSSLDYASSLAELSTVGLIESVLLLGHESGYIFSLSGATYEWECSATPESDRAGTRNFVVCTDGCVRIAEGSAAASCTGFCGE